MEVMAKCMLMVMAMIFLGKASSVGGNEAPTKVCNVPIDELAQCLPAITGKSPPEPSKGCCDALGKADLRCLCNHKSEISKYANPAKAMELPKKCGCKRLPHECKVHVFGPPA